MQSHENPQKTTSATIASNTTTEAATDELTVHVPARWGDMDAYGHVNNVAMLSIMEEARVALFGPPPSSGEKPTVAPNPPIPLFDLVPEGVQALIAEHGIRYLAQLPYTGEPVPVRARVEKVSAASVRIGYSILSPVDSRECVRAFTVLAFWDSIAGRLTRLSPEQRELLSSFLPKK
ncbi:acyl-CoA thioesterase [Rothia mucilaginosa]|uniref:acyl-CoA thioesterase n=1 Tax=Rothia mucilaginosa TaxID=43675 RepID=UPI001955FCFE|nr:acyl-CoA thioesterase [Rothia mucilaginosa]VTY07488.1 Thioesterase-like superfamily protein [Rothia mucilaginosa]